MEEEELFYCWACESHQRVEQLENTEWACASCASTFVERGQQNLEEFLHPQSRPPSPPSRQQPDARTANGAQTSSQMIVEQIMNRVLGLEVQTQGPRTIHSSLLSVLQNAAAESGRPVGIVVRYTAAANEIEALSQSLGSNVMSSGNTASTESTRGARMSEQPATGGWGNVGGGVGTERVARPRADFGSLLASLLGGDDGERGGLERRAFQNLLHHILMNESSTIGTPPASESAIQNLPRETVLENNIPQGECSITQEAFEVNDVVVTLPCGHFFKEEPIVHWLKLHGSCPTCRVSL